MNPKHLCKAKIYRSIKEKYELGHMTFMNEFCTGKMYEEEKEDGWIHVLYDGKFCGKYKKDAGYEGERWGVTFDESYV